MLLALLLLQAADPVTAGNSILKKSIVDAIRNCPVSTEGAVAVCSRDRGWAESEGRRLQKLKKPVGPPSAPAVTVRVEGSAADGCADPRGCRREEAGADGIDDRLRARLAKPK